MLEDEVKKIIQITNVIICISLLMGCSIGFFNKGKMDFLATQNIQSEGSIENPVVLSVDKIQTIQVGRQYSPSYYKIYIPQNNYYDSKKVTESQITLELGFQVYNDTLFTDNYYGDTNAIYKNSLSKIKLCKGSTYYIKIVNIEDNNGAKIDLLIQPNIKYPSLNHLSLNTLVNDTIGVYGISESSKYFSFTTNNAGYYTIKRSYPNGKQIFEMTYYFMPEDGGSLPGSFTNTNSVYSLLANTTYYIEVYSTISEPVPFTIEVFEGNYIFL